MPVNVWARILCTNEKKVDCYVQGVPCNMTVDV